jgi:hypothetical protein
MGYTVVWNYAVDRLTENVVARLGTGMHRAYQWVVDEYFGAQGGVRRLRREMGCRMEDAMEHRRDARVHLDLAVGRGAPARASMMRSLGVIHRRRAGARLAVCW